MRYVTLILLACLAGSLCWLPTRSEASTGKLLAEANSPPPPSDTTGRLKASATKFSPGASFSRLPFETTRRLAVTYLYVEMYWVFKGIYPNTLRELVEKSPGFPLDPLSPKMIVDPYSAYKLPLRYRVTVDRGPEIVSIGPDGHWGGWQDEGPTLFGTDDIKVTTRVRRRFRFGICMRATAFSSWKGRISH